MICSSSQELWESIRFQLQHYPVGARLSFPKDALPNPRQAGARVSVGLPVGQIADFRFDPDSSCASMHVQEYSDRWIAHIDTTHPDCGIIEHIRKDAPGAWCFGGAALGAAIGAALSRRGDAILAGASIGFLIALLTAGIKKSS